MGPRSGAWSEREGDGGTRGGDKVVPVLALGGFESRDDSWPWGLRFYSSDLEMIGAKRQRNAAARK